MTLAKECARAILQEKPLNKATLKKEMLSFVEECNDSIALLCLSDDVAFNFDGQDEVQVHNAILDRFQALTIELLPSIKKDYFQLATHYATCPDGSAKNMVTEAIGELIDSVTPENCPAWATYFLFEFQKEGKDSIEKEFLPNWMALAKRLAEGE
jgi:hypothetical protein